MDKSQEEETSVQGQQIVRAEVHQENEPQQNILPSPTHQTPSSNELGSGLIPNIPQHPTHQIQSSNELGSGLDMENLNNIKGVAKEFDKLTDDTRKLYDNFVWNSAIKDCLFEKWEHSPLSLNPADKATLIADCNKIKTVEKILMSQSEKLMQALENEGSV